MLPEDIWAPGKPRLEFPIFANCINRVSFTFGTEIERESRRRIIRNFLRILVRKHRITELPFRDLLYLVFGEKPTISVCGALLSRQGELIKHFGDLGQYRAAHSLDININDLVAENGLPINDGMFLIILSEGRRDSYRSSPGNFCMSYESSYAFTCYRTGAFARVLNDFSIKKHHGFLGINPKVIVNSNHCSSIFLINHSSNPRYNDTVYPNVRLYRGDGCYRDADYAPIPPFGGVEMDMEELFGPDVSAFLAPFGGLGTSVASIPDYSLASISMLRDRDRTLIGMEHTRPTHVNLQDLLAKLLPPID